MVIDWPVCSAPDREQKLQSEKLELKAQIRAALANLAARHGIAEGEVDQVMWAYIDQAVNDLTLMLDRGAGQRIADDDASVVPFRRPILNA